MNLLNATELAAAFLKKPLSKPEKNLVAKLEGFGVNCQTLPSDDSLRRSNPYSGFETVLHPACAALYDFCIESYATYGRSHVSPMTYAGNKVTLDVYDRTRYLVLKLWPDAYMNLLD